MRSFTDEKAFWIVSDAAHGASVASLMRKHGFTRTQFARWKKRWPIYVVPEPTRTQLDALWSWQPNWSRSRIWKTYRCAAEAIEAWCLPAFDGPEVEIDAVRGARSLLVCDKSVLVIMLNQRSIEERRIVQVTHSSTALLHGALPSQRDVGVISRYALEANVRIAYLGDLHPSSIHLFGALRAAGRERFLRSSRERLDVTWVGPDSRWIAWLERRSIDVLSIAVKMDEAARAYWKVMQTLMPDIRAVLGRRASELLDAGWHLDIDMIIAHVGDPALLALAQRLAD